MAGRRRASPSYSPPRRRRRRAGPRFYKGDDLTKTKLDRKLVGAKYERWERRRR